MATAGFESAKIAIREGFPKSGKRVYRFDRQAISFWQPMIRKKARRDAGRPYRYGI